MYEYICLAVIIIILIIYDLRCPCGCGCRYFGKKVCRGCKFTERFFSINNTRTITLHTVSWCPHCKIMKPVWDNVRSATANSGIIYREVDEDVAKTPGVKSYPTIRMVDVNGLTYEYAGGPNFTTLRNWVVAPAH